MSLKAFHIFFISLSVLLTLGFAAWEAYRFLDSGNPLELLAALLSIVLAAALVVYGLAFIRKMKRVSMI